ncbi:hypothetical protein PMAG_a0588 [Pseudoalteromonas mariniglutinosa NCIMB 1770]|nr:hypothetical protein [Pseudoalteromonas mariniglutinosa NCIMB 1770]
MVQVIKDKTVWLPACLFAIQPICTTDQIYITDSWFLPLNG